jgi:hypothetical protein
MPKSSFQVSSGEQGEEAMETEAKVGRNSKYSTERDENTLYKPCWRTQWRSKTTVKAAVLEIGV